MAWCPNRSIQILDLHARFPTRMFHFHIHFHLLLELLISVYNNSVSILVTDDGPYDTTPVEEICKHGR